MSAGAPIGLALAGGGPEGSIYEIGALRALEEAVGGLDLADLDVYVGVSAGAFVAANLVNRLSPAQMCRALLEPEPGEHPFDPEIFMQPALREYGRRLASAPGLLAGGVANLLRGRGERPVDLALRLGRALPVGLFDNEPIREYLERIYALRGRSDDFRRLRHPLFVIAADLETGEAVRFGGPGRDHVPISRAVQASSALPGLYPPVEIDGRFYVDGVLLKTLHASVALDEGARLVLCINPIVPVDLHGNGDHGAAGYLVGRGLPTVLSQTFRTLIHSRLHVGLAAYEERYPGADVVLLEPRRDDYRMFFTNIFSFATRRALAEHAYQGIRRQLLARYDELAPVFGRHGLALRRDVLEDRSRFLWAGVGIDPDHPADRRSGLETMRRLGSSLDRLERLLDAGAQGTAASQADVSPSSKPSAKSGTTKVAVTARSADSVS